MGMNIENLHALMARAEGNCEAREEILYKEASSLYGLPTGTIAEFRKSNCEFMKGFTRREFCGC